MFCRVNDPQRGSLYGTQSSPDVGPTNSLDPTDPYSKDQYDQDPYRDRNPQVKHFCIEIVLHYN